MINNRVFTLLLTILTLGFSIAGAQSFVHPGILHTGTEINLMISKVKLGAQPWKGSWELLASSPFAKNNYAPNPQREVCCGGNGCPSGESYMPLARDCAAAYQCALRYRISGDSTYADKTVNIMNAWASTFVQFTGDSNLKLRAGLYGYQFAAAAELVRGYKGWATTDFNRFKDMMVSKFYTHNSDFLKRHNNTCFDHYWANWDLANMTSVIAIGVLTDDRDKFNEAVEYFKNGVGTGQIDRLCNNLYQGNKPGYFLGQCQESGRDQGHATLCIALVGAFCKIAYDQGIDLFAYKDNKVLALCEYTAKYNLGDSVPWTDYTNCEKNTMTRISSDSRGTIRPAWELIYNHYVRLKGLYAPSCQKFADLVRPEGGGGNYGSTSGGFDQLGFGTLTYTLDTSFTNVNITKSFRQTGKNAIIRIVKGSLTYILHEKSDVKITVFDLRGHQLFSFSQTGQRPGVHNIYLQKIQTSSGFICVESIIHGRKYCEYFPSIGL